MPSIGDRLRRAREVAGFAEATEAAREHGWPIPTYLSHENGTRGAPVKKLQMYASAFNVGLEWLLTGADRGAPAEAPASLAPSNVGRTAEASAATTWPRDLPVYRTAIGGAEEYGAFEFKMGDVVDYVRRPPRLQGVKQAFAVFVVGESMLPRFRPGGPTVIHPGVVPTPGDDVLVELRPSAEGGPPLGLIKRLVSRTETRLRLQQFNPSNDDIGVPLKRVLRVHRIVPYEDLFGF